VTPLGTALRHARRGRDKSAFYRMSHLEVRAGLRQPGASPGPAVPFETALLALARETGRLEEVTRLLADYFAAEDRMVLKVMKHAAYPMTTALAATFIAPLPLLFTGAGAAAYAVSVGAGLALWAAAGGGLLAGVVGWYLQRPAFVLGRLLRALVIAVEAGLPLGRAAQLAADASGSVDVQAWVRRQGPRVTQQPLAATFRGCPHVDAPALAAMEVADASGDYGGTLGKLAELVEG
jgi:type II secretory pathway component PulF